MGIEQALKYPVAEARDTLTALVRESGVEPTKPIAAALKELDTIADSCDKAVAELGNSQPSVAELADNLAAAVADGTMSAKAAVGQLQRAEAKMVQSLRNRVAFAYNKRADRVLRDLGNTLITDILAPWAERIVTELVEPAAVVVEHGHRTGFSVGDNDLKEIYELADKLVFDLHAVYAHTNQLRGRKVLTSLADRYDPRLLAFKAPHRLADEAKAVRETWWMSYAITNGAGPIIRTSYEAEAAAKLVAA